MYLLLLTIDPIAFSLGPIDVRWYGVLIASGILLGYLFANREAYKQGLPEDFLVDFLMWAIPISIISARIYYVAMEWERYIDHPIRAFEIWNGGIAIHGGKTKRDSSNYCCFLPLDYRIVFNAVDHGIS